jgi:hypothetical protein
VLGLR